MAAFPSKPSTAFAVLLALYAGVLSAPPARCEEPPSELLLESEEIPVLDSEAPLSDSGAPLSDSGAPLSDSGAPLSDSGAPLFSIDSPLGDIEYELGRGLSLGDTGLHVGGFTTVEFDREDGEPGELELDGVNFLVLLKPNQYVSGFMELEVGDFFRWKTNESSVESNPVAKFERLYGDLTIGDPLTLRTGKFQTPVGRWNLVPAEPFVWTPIEPAFLEVAFDEHQTGTAALGTIHPFGGTLDYWVYGQVMDPLDASEDPDPADHSVGGRVQFGRSLEQWSIGSSFLATEIGGQWSYLGGLDAEFSIDRLLVTSEFTLQQGAIPDRDLWDVYVQGVFEVVPTFNLVGRYERLDFEGRDGDAHIGDFGIAWIPKPYLHFKASYRVTDKQTEEVRRGLSMSFSFIF